MPLVGLIRRTLKEISDDRIASVAAGVTFFALLAMFPAIASIVSLYGIFADRSSIGHVLDALSPYVPDGAVTVLGGEIHRLVAQKASKLDYAFAAGFVIALWSASGGVRALMDGLNVAYEVKERRAFIERAAMALFFTLAVIVLAAGILAFAVVLPVLLRRVDIPFVFAGLLAGLRLPLVYGFAVLIFEIVYRFGPDRRHERFHWISWGSGIGAAPWIGATTVFAWYVRDYGSYDRVYGNLGAAVGFLTWIWIMLVILLAGSELNCEIARGRR